MFRSKLNLQALARVTGGRKFKYYKGGANVEDKRNLLSILHDVGHVQVEA
jgi:hypothetical protein